MVHSLHYCLVFFLISGEFLFARTFTSNDGRQISAQLVDVEGRSIRLRRGDGNEFLLPADRLSDKDKTYVKDWLAFTRGKGDHPLGWKRLAIHTPDRRTLIKVIGIGLPVRELSPNIRIVEAPADAWIQVKFDLNHPTFGDPVFLLKNDGKPQWHLTFDGPWLYRSADGKSKGERIGCSLLNREKDYNRYYEKEIAPHFRDGMAVSAGFSYSAYIRHNIFPGSVATNFDLKDRDWGYLKTAIEAGLTPKALFLRTKAKSIEALEELKGLEALVIDAAENEIDDLAPLTKLTKLKQLDLTGKVPPVQMRHIGFLSSLKLLHLREMHFLIGDSEFLGQLKQLESLYIPRNCGFRTNHIAAMSNMTVVDNGGVQWQKNISDISKLKKLTYFRPPHNLTIEDLEKLEANGVFKHLNAVTLYQDYPLRKFPKIEVAYLQNRKPGWDIAKTFDTSNRLWRVNVSGMTDTELSSLASVAGGSLIEHLVCYDFDGSSLDALNRLRSLRAFDIWSSKTTKHLDFSKLQGLEKVYFGSMQSLESVEGLSKIPGLNYLSLGSNPKLRTLGRPGPPNRSLQTLLVSSCPELTDLNAFRGVGGLSYLYLYNLPKVNSIVSLDKRNPLTAAYVGKCGSLPIIRINKSRWKQ